MNAHDNLATAVDLVGLARAALVLAGQPTVAHRLEQIATLLDEEAEMLDEVAHGAPWPNPSGPEGATIGWYRTYDPATRKARQLNGLEP